MTQWKVFYIRPIRHSCYIIHYSVFIDVETQFQSILLFVSNYQYTTDFYIHISILKLSIEFQTYTQMSACHGHAIVWEHYKINKHDMEPHSSNFPLTEAGHPARFQFILIGCFIYALAQTQNLEIILHSLYSELISINSPVDPFSKIHPDSHFP